MITIDTVLNTYNPRILIINDDACVRISSKAKIDEETDIFIQTHETEIIKAIESKE